jgi:hypothetical protein
MEGGWGVSAGAEVPVMTEQAIRERVDALLAAMSVAEKAGQLTQHFYFGFMRDVPADEADQLHTPNQPEAVEAALARGERAPLRPHGRRPHRWSQRRPNFARVRT